ncbi:MAG TPA: tetratricopeptide repeat protein [Gemmataceae bacterium]|nr:tetratricopeptide repeat protein [Gemmataceae bacterium]
MKTRKRLNYRFVACMLVGAAVFGVGVHFVHGYQVKRNASVLLRQAEQAKKENDHAGETQYLAQYLGFVPNDTEARARFGQAVHERAKQTKSYRGFREAYFQLDTVLRHDPQRSDVRERQVEIAMDLRQFGDALAHINVLHNAISKDNKVEQLAELEQKRAICYERTGQFDKAVTSYEMAIRHAPEQIDNYVRVAVLFHERLDDGKKADEKVDKMVEANPKSFKAYLARAQYRLQFHAQSASDVKKAREDVRQARQLAPDEPEVVLAAAGVEQAQGSPQKAIETLLQGIQAHPRDPRPYLSLVTAEVREDKVKDALDHVRQGLKEVPEKDERYADLLHAKADLLVQSGELAEAEKTIAQLRRMNYSPPLLDFLQARIHTRQNEWSKASALLDNIHPQLGRLPGIQVQALLLLGQCHERLGNPDQALLAYQQARKLDPLSATAHYRIGSLLMAQGRNDEALTEFRQLLATAKKPAGLHELLVRSLIVRNRRLPAKERNLNEIRRELALAAKEAPDSVELPMMEAEALLLADPPQLDAARRLIDKARETHPDELNLWIASAQLAGREEALRILERAAARPKLAHRVELRLARLGFQMQPPAEAKTPEQQKKAAEDLRATLAQMEKEAAKLDETDRQRLLDGLAGAYWRLGDTPAAERLWQMVAQQQPTNLGVRLMLFDLALISKSTTALDRLTKEIRGIEGANGAFWRYAEASRLLQLARPRDDEQLTESGRRQLREARQYLVEAARRRPTWPRIPALEAEIDEIEEHFSAAIEKYQQALALGERRPPLVRRTVQLLFEQRRFDEANQAVRKLLNQENTLLAAGLGKLAAANLLSNPDPSARDTQHALDMALKSVSPDSKAYQDHLWLGRVLWSSGKPEEAEKSFKRACELGESVPETWVTLVAFLASVGKKKEAEQAIAQATKKIPSDQASLALASCYENIGDLQKADEHYQAALKAAPEDASMLRNVASFHLRRNQSAKAEQQLRAILALESKASQANTIWARRALAAVLASSSDRRRFEEALALVEKNLAESQDSLEDQRGRALLLATRLSRRKEAVLLLEDLNHRSVLGANERFILVRLYLAEDNWAQAERHMLILLASPEGKNPVYEAFYASHLLQHDDVAAAEAHLQKLEKTLPDAPLTRAIKARVLHAKGRDAEVLALLREYSQSKDADLVRTALLLEELASTNRKNEQASKKLYLDEAEALYRKHVAQSDRPERFLPLASFLGRKRDVAEALSFCDKARKHNASPQRVAPALSGVLRDSRPGVQYIRRVEKTLNEMLAKDPDSVPLLICLADVYDLQEHFAEAEAVYRRALNKDADNVMLLNNLAWLLAFQKPLARQEALDAINKAIDLVGPSPELRDTRGVVYIMLDQSDLALADLQISSAQAPSASHSFHLARALAKANRLREARQALEDANKRGFDVKALHPLEKPAGQRLAAILQLN